MTMRADIGPRFHSIEEALTWVFIVVMHIKVLAQAFEVFTQGAAILKLQVVPGFTVTETDDNTAVSETGTTDPRYFFTSSGCSRIASEIEQKITPAFLSSA